MMHPDEFYPKVHQFMVLPAKERHAGMTNLHTQAMNHYMNRLMTEAEAEAVSPVTLGDDHRTVLQIVGHIAEWERFVILMEQLF